jgi:hypothetical protein
MQKSYKQMKRKVGWFGITPTIGNYPLLRYLIWIHLPPTLSINIFKWTFLLQGYYNTSYLFGFVLCVMVLTIFERSDSKYCPGPSPPQMKKRRKYR